MAQYRGVLQFRDQRDYAWKEHYWAVGATSHQQVLDRMKVVAEKRAKMLGINAKIYRIQVSDMEVRGDSLDYTKEYAGPPTIRSANGNVASDQHDFAPAALRIVKRVGPQHHGFMYMSGLPDDIQLTSSGRPTSARFISGFDEFKLEMTSGRWGMRIRDLRETNPAKPITNIVTDPSVLVTIPSHGFSGGDVVSITGIKSKRPASGKWYKLQGNWAVEVIDANTVKPINWTPGTFVYLSGGTARARKYYIAPLSHFDFESWSPRRRGNSLIMKKGKLDSLACN